ncbi:MAG: NADH-quinone oxidoreductase subunit N [Cytophagaceae bacterium]|jgi:NADH-quinone oxidoreductase subunit N|nr:NADH-quinone oxidoreductase subunit N [Cytophagaceae bacterium]
MKTIILLSVLGIVAMMADIFKYRAVLWYLVLAGIGAAVGLELLEWNQNMPYYGMLLMDNYAVAFSCIILGLLFVWFLVSRDSYTGQEFNDADHYALILFSSVGALLMVSFVDLSLMFLGIEILSIPLYILAGSRKKDLSSNESSLKYFLMGSFTTGILLFGITLVYGATGTFHIERIASAIGNSTMPVYFYTGIALLVVGFGFKVSAVPFHFWTPDVYQGAPTFITAYMSTIVKTAGFAGFYRLFSTSFSNARMPELMEGTTWSILVIVLIVLTIVIGNLIAAYQTNAKRMLAYSGVAQAGYMLMAVLVSQVEDNTKSSLMLYMASYGLATLAAFTVLYYVQKSKGSDEFEAFTSLGKTNPLLAAVLTISMLSLAGIPPTAGFFAKFYLFTSVLKANPSLLWLVGVAIFGSLVSVYYYFKLIISMYGSDEKSTAEVPTNMAYQFILVAIVLIILFLGIQPGLITNLANL